MEFRRLHTWGEFKYVARMDCLMLFDASGTRVAEWYVGGKGEYDQWYLYCLVNTLSWDLSFEFKKSVLSDWKKIVDTKLRAYYAT